MRGGVLYLSHREYAVKDDDREKKEEVEVQSISSESAHHSLILACYRTAVVVQRGHLAV